MDEKDFDEMPDDLVVEFTDEEGNTYYYREEMIIPLEDKKFAVLVPIHLEDECGCGEEHCECGECSDENSDEDAFIARVDVEDGEEVYVDPTEEEFQAVMKAYEAILAEDDEEA